MIHAGVADSRQWNNEFAYFAADFRVVRYDMRGYRKSEPVAGEYSHLADLTALLDDLHVDGRAILMGCSMGGGLAMNFALIDPSRTRALGKRLPDTKVGAAGDHQRRGPPAQHGSA